MEILKLIIPLFATLFGIILGALLHQKFANNSNVINRKIELRNNTYLDLVNSMSGMMIAQKNNMKKDFLNHLVSFSNSKVRLILYGSKEVIKKYSAFAELGEKTFTDNQVSSFLDLCIQIREENINDNIDKRDIEVILFSKSMNSV